MENRPDVEECTQLLRELANQRFFGSLEVKMEAGRITTVKKTETLKPGHLAWNHHRENRGQQNERNP